MGCRRLSALAIGLPILLNACGNSAGVATAVAPTAPQTSIPRQPSSASPGLPSATSPAAPSAPGTSVATVARTITEADDGATIQVAVGAIIGLALRAPSGSDPWQVHPPDLAILTPVALPGPTAAPAVTMQGYRAVGAGQTAITAESRPHCDPGKACARVIQGFRVTVVVTA